MKNFKVRWDQRGHRVTLVASYGESAAKDRKAALEAEGRTNVEIIETPVLSKRVGA
ncbi:hypothetical protein [Actinacidiphila glaucinigra]|uniref:hypothetical protein n=1 Tax=Actinacidiphila glaucinigra TaxID=235986 RepID=UPI002E334015|nr:hypothetical protein [Actinacidiphila glaucinigra]